VNAKLISPAPSADGEADGPKAGQLVESPRLLFIGSLDAAPTYGGPIQFYRHFVERNDFEFRKLVEPSQERFVYLKTRFSGLNRIIDRASRTRLFPHFAALNEWRGIAKSAPALVREAGQFAPDAIVTVAFGCYGFAAVSVAKKLKLPLVTFFHDWWPDISLRSRPGIAVFDRLMRRLYRASDLALCVCDEMKSELGSHPNAQVLFPICSQRNGGGENPGKRDRPRVVYLGGMTRGYGRMISALCHSYAAALKPAWELAVFGETKDWSATAVGQASTAGIYRGPRFGREAEAELRSADLFLVVMDFENETRRRVRTSFPSKLLDYCSYGKPVVIWAPAYSSLVRFAARHPFAWVYSEKNPEGLVEQINLLAQDQTRLDDLSNRAAQLAGTVFSPETIHRQLVGHIRQLLSQKS
jgi:glycosyltransferase involved in cell wall biosynthesis